MSESRQAICKIKIYDMYHMSEEDRRYLRIQKNMTPSLEVFKRLVKILTSIETKTDQLIKNSLNTQAQRV